MLKNLHKQDRLQNGLSTSLNALKAKCFSGILMNCVFKYTYIVDYNCYLILVICFYG